MFFSLCVPSLFADQVNLISECQAADGVSASYDELLELFDSIGSFLKRLHIYAELSLDPLMKEIVAKIMVELISILALSKKYISRGRLSKQAIILLRATASKRVAEHFAKKLLGDTEIEAILKRLDRLTWEEAHMTAAQTLAIVQDLMNNLKVVIDGACNELSRRKISHQAVARAGGELSMSAIRQTLGKFKSSTYIISGSRITLVTMQEVVCEINKMKRGLSHPMSVTVEVEISLR